MVDSYEEMAEQWSRGPRDPAALVALLRTVAEEEREACARIAEGLSPRAAFCADPKVDREAHAIHCARQIAREIRARGRSCR
jgi:hypothetical protein